MLEVLALMIPLAPFLMVGFIVWTRHQRRMAEMQMQLGADEAASSKAHARLEERVRVLERIVTDRGYDLASQIEALRHDEPAPRPAAPAAATPAVAARDTTAAH
jgi:hypothetical protein